MAAVFTGGGIVSTQDITNRSGLTVDRNINEAGTAPLAKFINDHASNTQPTVLVQQDGAGYGISIDQNGTAAGIFIDQDGAASALVIDTEQGNPAVQINAKLGIRIEQDVTNGYGLFVSRDVAHSGINPLVTFLCDNVTSTQPTLSLQNDGSGAHITTGATNEDLEIDPNGTGMVDMTGAAKISISGTILNGSDSLVDSDAIFDYIGDAFKTVDASNISAVEFGQADGTSITESFDHNHNQYFLTTGGVIDGNVNFNSDAQADDDYEISLVGITALKVGMTVTFIANTANTDACTLEITEVGEVDEMLKMHDQVLATGDIEAGQVVVCVFDGTNWQMTSQVAQ